MRNQIPRAMAATAVAAIILAGAIGFASSGWLTTRTASAQGETSETTLPRTITVIGEGKVRLEPDIARANIGVEVLKETVQEASAENAATMESILAALKEQGIAEDDIQTSGFTIYAERFGPEGPLPEEETRYRVSNNVSIVIRDLDTVGTVLDAAVEAGANNIYGVDFSLEHPDAAASEARAKAIADAQAKAEELATLAGVQMGDVISISEVIGSGGGYYPGSFAQASFMGGGGGGAPISPGQLELTMQLQMVYALTD